MPEKDWPQCARCPHDWADRYCRREGGKPAEFCPSVHYRDLVKESLKVTLDDEHREFARQASIQEGEGYGGREKGYSRIRPIKTRLEEVMEFSEKMGFKKLGLAFCIGLRKEAAIVEEIFTANGFMVASVACKAGRTPKEELGLRDDQKVAPGSFESMCNPILQAMVLNRVKTDFNVLLGLCVGHDSLFLKHAEAPCTVLAVKDRQLAHNPLAAVYQADAYYRSIKNK